MSYPSKLRRAPLISALALALCAGAVGAAQAADPMTRATGGKLASGDKTFIEKATIGGMTEVRMGELASEKAINPQVKEFGARMVKDHTAANADLVKVAAAKGVTVPGTIDQSHQKDIDSLAKKSGADFDKAYVEAMVSDHKTDVADFEKQAKSGKDADLQAFAGKTLPTLKDHLKMIQGINDSMK